jgi:hypothetical protein
MCRPVRVVVVLVNRDRIERELNEASVACGCDDEGHNREPIFWGDAKSDAALDALVPIVEALVREAVDEALEAAATEIDGGPYSMKYITVQAATRIVRSHKENQ